ncbi:hypothetical protein [Shewanella sp. NIFS-20-20]|uniref:hypothetical protein n=1 Tax=Shewanella sp. NIFS-20-20 TaxID=2853806 RepID=UPI001C45F438|nr:hypothetical protein [Shewanella sp. NIFS-20-20]MBV7317561.1 hypothetical protein [Shewanella sp. NIFS-20-20]
MKLTDEQVFTIYRAAARSKPSAQLRHQIITMATDGKCVAVPVKSKRGSQAQVVISLLMFLVGFACIGSTWWLP